MFENQMCGIFAFLGFYDNGFEKGYANITFHANCMPCALGSGVINLGDINVLMNKEYGYKQPGTAQAVANPAYSHIYCTFYGAELCAKLFCYAEKVNAVGNYSTNALLYNNVTSGTYDFNNCDCPICEEWTLLKEIKNVHRMKFRKNHRMKFTKIHWMTVKK